MIRLNITDDQGVLLGIVEIEPEDLTTVAGKISVAESILSELPASMDPRMLDVTTNWPLEDN